jgi:hypothetical protein
VRSVSKRKGLGSELDVNLSRFPMVLPYPTISTAGRSKLGSRASMDWMEGFMGYAGYFAVLISLNTS